LAAEVADIVYSAFAFRYGEGLLRLRRKPFIKVCRTPDALRIMTGIMPVIGRTREEAQAKLRRLRDRFGR
jgi:alkanesulfonate monooxygenase SsuD/methylene tetrahydromethanopterin reductase-like flavin-dependent oxidoreductase (luciferase family)